MLGGKSYKPVFHPLRTFPQWSKILKYIILSKYSLKGPMGLFFAWYISYQIQLHSTPGICSYVYTCCCLLSTMSVQWGVQCSVMHHVLGDIRNSLNSILRTSRNDDQQNQTKVQTHFSKIPKLHRTLATYAWWKLCMMFILHDKKVENESRNTHEFHIQ